MRYWPPKITKKLIWLGDTNMLVLYIRASDLTQHNSGSTRRRKSSLFVVPALVLSVSHTGSHITCLVLMVMFVPHA